ncbi:MAG: SLBB domain-containing protein, partial [bacterium]
YYIGRDGYVYIDPLKKQTYLAGMTYRRIKSMIRKIAEDMAGVEGDVRIISTHSIKVNAAGHAQNPGTISLPPFYTFWQALMLTKGPATLGSVRDIKLVRQGKTIYNMDVYSFLKTGNIPNISIRDNDLIFFGEVGKVVSITGFVRRPGWFELKKNETLGDLVYHAGNLKSSEFASLIQIERLIELEDRTSDGPTRKIIDIDITDKTWEKIALQNGDIISSKDKETFYKNDVFISGNGIRVPGRYSISPSNSTLRELIKNAGDFIEGYSRYGECIRITPDGTKSIQIDFKDALALKQFQLAAGDNIITYHNNNFRDQTLVRASGFVRNSINVPYSDSLSLYSLLQRGGGTGDGALPYIYVKSEDDFGNITYKRYPIEDTSFTSTVMLDRRDEIIAFDYRNFNNKFPVTVLAFNKPPLLLEYSADLSLEIIIHRLNGLNNLTDSSRVEIVSTDFSSHKQLAISKFYKIEKQALADTGIIEPGVIVFFRKDPKKNLPQYAAITGEVLSPGNYALTSRNESLSNILRQSGGFSIRANPYSLKINRSGLDYPIPVSIKSVLPALFETDWVLNNGDVISVERDDYLVEISGAVYQPGIVAYNGSWSWKDYLKKGAGGHMDTADVKNAYIIYPNGITKKARQGWFSNTRVVSGSRIIVPVKPYNAPATDRKEFDYSKFLATLTTSLTAVLTLVIIYERVGN